MCAGAMAFARLFDRVEVYTWGWLESKFIAKIIRFLFVDEV